MPKSIIYKAENGSYTSVTNLVYDGNKILSISNKNKRNDYQYEGDKIVKEIQYNYESGKEVKILETSFTYENDKLIVVNKISERIQFKYLYSYNEDGTITREIYEVDSKTGKELKRNANEVLTFTEGNLTKRESYYVSDSVSTVETLLYRYDTSNSAFKNVSGIKYLLGEASFDSVGSFSPINNLKETIHYTTYQSDYTINDYVSGFKYEYNKEGYPTKKIIFALDNLNEIIEYNY
ncbi:hypothetical protein ABXT06_06235 [Flavobacterium sp. UW10123]|uniref:hypothetical protein n=1 Tax=Flavobacterium sp. UW10123 TaxID=3230800 RepID=UPI003399FDFD